MVSRVGRDFPETAAVRVERVNRPKPSGSRPGITMHSNKSRFIADWGWWIKYGGNGSPGNVFCEGNDGKLNRGKKEAGPAPNRQLNPPLIPFEAL